MKSTQWHLAQTGSTSLQEVVEQGARRTEAYEAIQRNAIEVWERGASFQDLVSKDPFVTKYLSVAEIAACFDPKYYLRHIGNIYQRVFGSSHQKQAKRKHRA